MRRTITLAAIAALILYLAVSFARGADWPMWRCDARRSGVASEVLPEQLYPQWVRKLPPAMLAWPNESRLHFDASYEPVAAG
ncbi:MAG TPA: hypothetical protein VM285_14405, partial [Polyangia bacterium]|nr:hypothetical protein [Polyangia bacterium]